MTKRPAITLSLVVALTFDLVAAEMPPLNNAALIPRALPDSAVKVEGLSPDWVKTLIMAQFRIETATPAGTFAAATRVLDHYAGMGVNGLWINPVQERGSKGNGYRNFGPNTIEPLLTGKNDYSESLEVVERFVEEAHRRNIRVIFDIVVWGTAKNSPLVESHPEFYRRKDGQFAECWGGYGFDWKSSALKTWFKKAAVEFIERTHADGFRVDLAPDTSGYFFKEIREALYAKGRKILIVSEMTNTRNGTFDFEQVGVHGWMEEPIYSNPEKLKEQQMKFGQHNDFLFKHNLVEVVKSGRGIGKASLQQEGSGGQFRFYTSNLLNHDDDKPFVNGSRVRIGYAAIFAPFIPMWWIGEEWDNPKVPLPDPQGTGVMYFNTIDWSSLGNTANQAFFEDVKRYIRIRRSFPEIFEQFPENHREANITKLDTKSNGTPNPLQAYARLGAGEAVLIIPNDASAEAEFTITPDYAALHLDSAGNLKVTDLITGKTVKSGSFRDLKNFTVLLEARYLGIYLVEKEQKPTSY